MAIKVPRGASLRNFELTDFSGLLNLRDSPAELADNESPDCLNVRCDARGGIVKRLGLAPLNAASPLSSAPPVMYYSAARDETYVQDGAAVKKTTDWSTFTTIHTFTTSARVAISDFLDYVLFVHPADGVFSYDGTFTLANSTAKGTCLAIWQNRAWVAGDPANKSRVWFSAIGNGKTWATATDWVDVRDKDNAPITALGYGANMDFAGRAGLLVFKEESAYRINSSITGAYTTLDAHAGAAGPAAVATVLGLTVAVSKSGVYVTDGVAPLKQISQKLAPLFRADQLNFAALSGTAVGIKNDHLLISLPRAGSSINNRTLEFHPEFVSFAYHDFGVASFAQYTKQQALLYGAGPSNGRVFDVFKGGTDDGAPIAARFQTKWFEPAGQIRCSFVRGRIEGRGVFDLYAKLDYEIGDGSLVRTVDLSSAGSVWGGGVWGGGVWGASARAYATTAQIGSLGYGQSLALVVKQTSGDSATGVPVLDGATPPEVGDFALYRARVDFAQLGYS